MQESKKEAEMEAHLAEIVRKYNKRMSVIFLIGGLEFLMAGIWGSFFFQTATDISSFLILHLLLSGSFCALALMSPAIDKWRISRANHILLPPAGWDTFVLSILWVLLIFWDGMREVHYLEPQGLLRAISYFSAMCLFCLFTFLVDLPQARRSVYLSLRVYSREPLGLKQHSFPMDCWRDERFDTIIKRLSNKRKFKRRFAHLLIPPNSQINLVYHDKILQAESTPSKEGLRFYARVMVTLGEKNGEIAYPVGHS